MVILNLIESLEKSPRTLLTDLLEIMPLRVNPYDTESGFKDIAAFIGKGTPYYDCYIIYSSKAESLFAKKLFDFLEKNQIYAYLDVECCAPGRRKSSKLWWEGTI